MFDGAHGWIRTNRLSHTKGMLDHVSFVGVRVFRSLTNVLTIVHEGFVTL